VQIGCSFPWMNGHHYTRNQTISMALSPRANYIDWATATCQRNLVSTFVDRGVSRGYRDGTPTVVNLRFLERSRYFSFKQLLIYPHKGWVDPVPDSLLRRKSFRAGNRTRDLRFCSQYIWPLDHRGGHRKYIKTRQYQFRVRLFFRLNLDTILQYGWNICSRNRGVYLCNSIRWFAVDMFPFDISSVKIAERVY
jgi:hypothetical protein